nr:MAG TPA: hypothetical protein [Caudoviricetes sp.]
MGTTPNHINHIPKSILHHHLLAEVVYRIRLLPNLQIQIPMKQRKSIKVSKDKAIIIASNHNNIPIQKAKAYTDSELREVLRHLNLRPGF